MAKSKLKGRKENHKFYLEREKEIERKREAIRIKKLRKGPKPSKAKNLRRKGMGLQLLRGEEQKIEGWTKVERQGTHAKETMRISKSALKKKQEEGVVIMEMAKEQH